MKRQRKNHTHARGFTLIELVVVLGIVTVISTLTLTSYAKFGGQVLLRNLAYDIALTVRQAQVHGLSGRSFSDQSTDSSIGHGIRIDLATDESARQFSMFSVRGKNDRYGAEAEEVVGELYKLGRGFLIDELCFAKGGVESCTRSGKVDILFKRPEPDAIIRGDTAGAGLITYDSVQLILLAPQGYKLSVFIEAAGQISIQKVTTP